jgi:hypothetical protein
MISKYKQNIINNKEEEKKKKEEEKKKKEEEKKKKEEEKKKKEKEKMKKMMEDKMNKIENKLNKIENKIEKHAKEHAKYPLSIDISIKKKQHENKNVIISDITIEKELNETPETPNEKENETHDLQFTRCKHVLKTGINKGSTCSCKIFQDELCKRHYLNKN